MINITVIRSRKILLQGPIALREEDRRRKFICQMQMCYCISLLPRRFCFHFVCLFVSRITQKLLAWFSQISMESGTRKTALDSGGNRHHVVLWLG